MVPPGEHQGQDSGKKGGGGSKRALKTRQGESNQRTIPHLRLSEAIYLRKWGRFWWEGVCWYVCPPDPSVISHIKGSTTRQLAYRREGLQEFGGFSEICSSSPELSESTGGKKKKKVEKLNDIFDAMNIWHSCCSWLCACICSSSIAALVVIFSFALASEAFTMPTNSLVTWVFFGAGGVSSKWHSMWSCQ